MSERQGIYKPPSPDFPQQEAFAHLCDQVATRLDREFDSVPGLPATERPVILVVPEAVFNTHVTEFSEKTRRYAQVAGTPITADGYHDAVYNVILFPDSMVEQAAQKGDSLTRARAVIATELIHSKVTTEDPQNGLLTSGFTFVNAKRQQLPGTQPGGVYFVDSIPGELNRDTAVAPEAAVTPETKHKAPIMREERAIDMLAHLLMIPKNPYSFIVFFSDELKARFSTLKNQDHVRLLIQALTFHRKELLDFEFPVHGESGTLNLLSVLNKIDHIASGKLPLKDESDYFRF